MRKGRGGGVALAVIIAAGALGCSKITSMASGGGEAGGGGTTVTGGSAAPAAEAPCIAGKWDAKDLSSRIKTSIKSAANAGLTPVGGKITYDISAPGADNRGFVTVTITDFVTKFAMAQQGVNVNGTITLTGPAKMPYTNGPADLITVDKPTEGKINAHADVQTSGIVSTRKTEDSNVDLTGAFLYECAGDKLQLWNKNNGRQSQPLVFTRIK